MFFEENVIAWTTDGGRCIDGVDDGFFEVMLRGCGCQVIAVLSGSFVAFE
jgi:hypothetical protein